MSKFSAVSLMCAFSCFVLIGCSRRGVEAAGEVAPGAEGPSEIYQPRLVPPSPNKPPTKRSDIRGQLSKVSISNQTIVIRTQNGMEQTVKFDEQTNVTGRHIKNDATVGALKPGTTRIRNLRGKEGSEVSIRWRPKDEMKVANAVILLD